MKTVIFSQSSANSAGTLHFIWKVEANLSKAEIVAANSSAVHKVRPLLPSLVRRCATPAVMREMYRRLTGMCGFVLYYSTCVCNLLH